MKKMAILVSCFAVAGVAAFAGGLAEGVMEPEVLGEAEKSRNWILPAILLLGVAAIVASNDSSGS